MTWIIKLYLLALKLYPRSFCLRFALEMEAVFVEGLEEAKAQGEVAGFILRELLRLPGSLAGVYIWSMRAGEGKPVAVSGVGGGGTVGMNVPGEGWGTSVLAGLPHLILGTILVVTELISGVTGVNSNLLGNLFLIGFCLLLLGVVIFSLFRGWKIWTASWIVYMFWVVLALSSIAWNELSSSVTINHNWVDEFQVVVIPLLLAYFLYKITCKDRLRGLLAAVPSITIIWIYFLEFVPSIQKSLAWAWLVILAFTATVMMVRTKRFSTALGLAMIVPILGGFPFVYLGVYMGGTLPFSEPGPSLMEVFRQYLPFLVMALAVVLGPQLAAKLRTLGQQSGKAGGKFFYRLILGGILLGLLFALFQWAIMSSGFDVQTAALKALLIVATMLYLAGFALLMWAAYRSKLPSDDNSNLVELAALFLPLMFVPLAILLAVPISFGTSSASWMLPLAEIAWVVAAVFVVKD